MSKRIIYIALCLLCTCFWANAQVSRYNLTWDSPSLNSSESMPCGGGDIGLNVWVEDGDILFYLSRSGTFDENNTLLKLGRVRLQLSPNPFQSSDKFRQTLNLKEGCVEIEGSDKSLSSKIRIWVDVFHPLIQVEVEANKPVQVEASYENWRYQDRLLRKNESNQNSYKWAAPQGLVTKQDQVAFEGNRVVFYHRNTGETVFDIAVKQQGLDSVKDSLFNPLYNLTFGGMMQGKGFRADGTSSGTYNSTDFQAWTLRSEAAKKKHTLNIRLHTGQTETLSQWQSALQTPVQADRKKTLDWWKGFWNRSFITIDGAEGAEIARNYTLFRYMLGCNAYGDYPTKFNGGLFTYDPVTIDSLYDFTPDFRKWGGGTHTAQNQRLVYFPMLPSGDADMMTGQFEFYRRILPNAELRSQVYWGHSGACFTEQIENFGLPNPSEYGWKRPDYFDPGMEYNAWLEYQWDTALEFCFLILEKERYTGADISPYIPLIESCLTFFEEHYEYLARLRGRKVLDEEGKLVLYPGSACETYKMAYNAASTVAALSVVSERLMSLSVQESYTMQIDTARLARFIDKIPPIEHREIEGHTTISPARLWERINNTESPQLYPVFPWGIYGLGRPDLEVARNTYQYDPDVVRFRSHVGWKQDAIWAARLGLTEEARELTVKKLGNSGRRFPAFWGPGFDWTPDHNWGGSGMIALQEMLLQANGEEIYLLPAWPKEWNVHFKLHAPYNTTVECRVENGEITLLNVFPKEREKDLILSNHFNP